MNFLEFITEAAKSASQQNKPKKPTTSQKGQKTSGNLEDKHVAITFGRFNPPHAGPVSYTHLTLPTTPYV